MDAGMGTPQGNIVSPVLANVFLHYALDLWFHKKWRPNVPDGEVRSSFATLTISLSGSNTSGMRSATCATFGRGWPGSVSACTRTRPASWSLAGSRC